jgi:hypothetical protein
MYKGAYGLRPHLLLEEKVFSGGVGVKNLPENCIRRPGREQTQRATPRPVALRTPTNFLISAPTGRMTRICMDTRYRVSDVNAFMASSGCGPLAASSCTKRTFYCGPYVLWSWVASTAPPLEPSTHQPSKSVGSLPCRFVSCLLCIVMAPTLSSLGVSL